MKPGWIKRTCALFVALCITALIGWGLSWLAVSAVEMAPTLLPVNLYPPLHGCVDITPLCP